MIDPLPMMDLFDKQIQLRMGQANVKRWIDELMPLVIDDERPARRRRPRDAQGSRSREAPHMLRDLPEEAGRRDQGRAEAVTGATPAAARAPLPSGEQFELTHGDRRAVVVEVGGGLRSFAVGDWEVLDGYGADERIADGRGQILIRGRTACATGATRGTARPGSSR